MYVHGEMLFPDYVAIALLITTVVFLLSCIVYGIFDVVGFRLDFTKLRLNVNQLTCLINRWVVGWKLALSLRL